MTLRLQGSTSGYTELDAPAVAGSNTLVLPGGNGSANQRLVTDGSGTLSFSSDVMLAAGSAGSPSLYFSGDTNTGMWSPAADTVAWSTGGLERMRISNTGNVSIGTTASGARLELLAANQVGMTLTNTNTNDLCAVKGNAGGSSGSSVFVMPMRFGDDTLRGSIFWNGSTVAYNTTSDYRLKENVDSYTGALDKLARLKPVTYNFIDNPSVILDGFIAHEVENVVPNAVSGIKDEVDSEGNPLYQGLDTAKLVPLLTAALQEAITKIEFLEARLTALEVTP